MSAVRVTRQERQAQTRAALVHAAAQAFLDHGYDGASLGQIAAAAGVTTGAVYANFGGKDDLFLAVLDDRSSQSIGEQARIAAADLEIDDALRAIARLLVEEYGGDPRWAAVYAEYWARAARNADFGAVVARRFDAIVTEISGLMERLAAHHGMAFTIPVTQAARGAGALVRGIRLERAMGLGEDVDADTFAEMFRAYARGLMRPAAPGGHQGEGT